jgi:ADP-heptose:LPS heptosyltransferase
MENRALVGRIIRTLAGQAPVVLLNTGFSVDDHEDFDTGAGLGVHKIDHLMQPNRNLEIQSQVISRAKAFVGTYGGLAYLGPYYGVPSIALYSDESELVQAHLDVSRRYARRLGTPLVMLHAREVDLIRAVIA